MPRLRSQFQSSSEMLIMACSLALMPHICLKSSFEVAIGGGCSFGKGIKLVVPQARKSKASSSLLAGCRVRTHQFL